MIGIAQFGIAVSALGSVLAFMGLFPGVAGIDSGRGVGIVQYTTILVGFSLLHLGAMIYVKYTFYADRAATLAQQVGIRLTLTGLLFGGMAGLADFLGFGSHIRTETTDVVFGPLQAIGAVGGLLVAALGVIIFATRGQPPEEGGE
jgi:predicted amidohydrolase